MTITFMQTCDAVRYAPLLEIGSLTVKAYIYKFGYSYVSFIGIRRGIYPWQASYNRIPMLMEMVEAGYNGWVCYMDADSYIADLNFDLNEYLADKNDVALIAAHSGVQPPLWFDVNNGVFLINLGHPKAKNLVEKWYREFMSISDTELSVAELWEDVPHDQLLLHRSMQDISDMQNYVIVDMSHPKLLNYPSGRFIRQVLRDGGGTIKERAASMMSDVELIMSSVKASDGTALIPVHADVSLLEESFIEAVYHTFFLRKPDTEEFRAAVKRFRAKRNTMEQEMRDCLSSPEFSAKSEAFLKEFAPKSILLQSDVT